VSNSIAHLKPVPTIDVETSLNTDGGYAHAFPVPDAVGLVMDGPNPFTLEEWEEELDYGAFSREARLVTETERQLLQMEARDAARQQLAAANWEPPTLSEDILTELAKDAPPVQYVVEDLAPAGSNVLLVAEAKAGKTTLVMNLVSAIVTGSKFLGRYGIDALPEGSSITYLNFELEKNMAENWLRDMEIASEPETHRHRLFVDHWKGFPLPLPSEVTEDYLVDVLNRRASSVLVLDPYGAAINHDENSNDDTRAWTNSVDRIARRAGLALVVIAAHSGSSSVSSGDLRVRGAYRLEDWMSVKWTYTHGGEVNEPPPDRFRYLAARGRDVAIPQFTVDYAEPRRRLFVASGSASKTANEAERWALKVYDAVFAHEHRARAEGQEPGPLKAGDLRELMGIAQTDSKTRGKSFNAGRGRAVASGWITETPGQGNSKLYAVGEVDPRAKITFPGHRTDSAES
jgi:hypothetical protein